MAKNDLSRRTDMERLDRVAGHQTARLTHYGRKSGKAYGVTIWFVVDGERMYLGTANVNRQWVRNVQTTPNVELRIGGEVLDGAARFLADQSEHERAQARIRKKYWIYWPVFVVVRVLVAIGFVKNRPGSFEVTVQAS
jgi:deazaflavin-dependent oxidoreductase (nitroreductase family)